MTAPQPTAIGPSPLSHWKLQSVWVQTGAKFATINNHIYSEGDRIEGYRVGMIESDRVWLQGPAGWESLGFDNLKSSPAHSPPTTAPPANK